MHPARCSAVDTQIDGMIDEIDGIIDGIFGRPPEEGVSLAVVLQHRGDVVAERYGTRPENVFQPAQTIDADSTLISWSMAKSITHAVVGVLVRDGLLDVGAPAPVPEWAGADKAGITVLDLLEMRSGLRNVEDFVGSSYVRATARDFARFGGLYLHDGVTDDGRGEQILPAGRLDHARTIAAIDPHSGFGYGRHWWSWPQLPGSLACYGYQGQRIIVVPDRDLVLVHLGLTPVEFAPQLDRRLADLVESC